METQIPSHGLLFLVPTGFGALNAAAVGTNKETAGVENVPSRLLSVLAISALTVEADVVVRRLCIGLDEGLRVGRTGRPKSPGLTVKLVTTLIGTA